MKHTNRETKWLLVILLVGTALRLALFIAIYPDETKAFTNDSFGYHRLAVNLVRYHLFSPSSGSPFEPELSGLLFILCFSRLFTASLDTNLLSLYSSKHC